MTRLIKRSNKRTVSIHRLAAAAPKQRLALLLSGGDGKRLQELTTQLTGFPVPKQYYPLLRGRSLLELTLFRTHYFAPVENTWVVINQDHAQFTGDMLHSLPAGNIFVQPENRDTGPGIIFALSQIARTDPDAVVAAFPTDHFIDDEEAFMAYVLKATCIIHRLPQKIAILGVPPGCPEADYGYIIPGRPLSSEPASRKASRVQAFIEKPGCVEARRLIFQGGLWNTFVMVFQLKQMLALLREMAPEDSQKLFEIQDYSREAAAIYRDIHPWSFSEVILAHIPEKLVVLEAPDIHWSDWGRRESIERTLKLMNFVPAWRPLDYDSGYRGAWKSVCSPA
jgi:mannose-1-phosphate guanylyltransferase